MKTFLLKDKKPIVKWGMIPDETYFEGNVPIGYGLAVNPSKEYIILDVDRHNNIDGFTNIPLNILAELEDTLNYNTKNNGKHYWIKFTGNKELINRTSGLGLDLRTNNGYVKWYLKEDIRDCISSIKPSSKKLNKFIEKHFSNDINGRHKYRVKCFEYIQSKMGRIFHFILSSIQKINRSR
jgi:hypothetical protein